MSDGPHRSLQMRRGWKQVAERGDNYAFEPDEISEAIIPALEQDYRSETPKPLLDAVWSILCDQQSSLFNTDTETAARLEALRTEAGTGIGRVVVEQAILVAEKGDRGRDAVVQALNNALTDRAARGARQVEEHYLRSSSSLRATQVRSRIEEGIAGAGINALARQILTLDQGSSPRPKKHEGLDDGVKLK